VEEERREFLPPEPAGPEPELGPGPAPGPPPPAQPPPAQPPPAYPTQQYPPQPPPPPGYPPYGWQQPPPPGWGYPPPPPQPDNGPAVTGFVLSLVSAGLLFVSGGISSIVSIGCSIAAIVYARKGKAKVERGETQKNRGLAQAGFIIGIVGLVLAVLATLVWALIVVALITDDEFRRDFENEFDNSNSINAALRVAAAGARLLIC
jgi:hypothetical protein